MDSTPNLVGLDIDELDLPALDLSGLDFTTPDIDLSCLDYNSRPDEGAMTRLTDLIDKWADENNQGNRRLEIEARLTQYELHLYRLRAYQCQIDAAINLHRAISIADEPYSPPSQ